MIYKVLVGDEHGGAAESSSRILDNFLPQQNFYVIFLCNGKLCQKYLSKYKNAFCLETGEPPIISSNSIINRILNHFKFLFWVLRAVLSLYGFVSKRSIKFIHTTNNHALLIVLLTKIIKPSLYIVSHWRCVGLASAGQYKFLLHKINKVICISKVVKKSLPEFLQNNSTIIYDGVDVQALSIIGEQNKGQLRNDLRIDPKCFLVGTIGSFTPIKCHDLLIESFSHINIRDLNIKLLLFGSCPNDESRKYLTYLKEKVNELNLSDRISFVTDNEYNVPRNYISDLNLFVGATWNKGLGEGFGLIYVEAMAQKLPVIAIEVGAAREIIEKGHTGFLIKENNSEELVQVILQTYKQKDQIRKMGYAGYEVAKNQFNISITTQKVREVYCSLLK